MFKSYKLHAEIEGRGIQGLSLIVNAAELHEIMKPNCADKSVYTLGDAGK